MAKKQANEPVSKITFEYEGEKYTLEFDRESVLASEKMFDISINDIQSLKMVAFDGLFRGAFLKHHADIDQDVVEEIMGCFKDKLGLFKHLSNMYGYCWRSLIDDPADEGNAISWEAM